VYVLSANSTDVLILLSLGFLFLFLLVGVYFAVSLRKVRVFKKISSHSETQLQRKEDEIYELKKELIDVRRERDTFKLEKDNAKSDIEKIKVEIVQDDGGSQSSKSFNNNTDEIVRGYEEQRNRAIEAKDRVDEILIVLSREKDELQQRLQHLNRVQSTNIQLQKQFDELHSRSGSFQEHLEREVHEARSDLRIVVIKNKELYKENIQLKDTVNNLRMMEHQSRVRGKEIERLKKENAQLFRRAQGRLKQFLDELSTKEVLSLNAEKINEENSRLRVKINEIYQRSKSQISKLEEALKDSKKRREFVTDENKQLVSRIEELSGKIRDLRTDQYIADARVKEIERLKQENQRLVQQASGSEKQDEQLRRTLAENNDIHIKLRVAEARLIDLNEVDKENRKLRLTQDRESRLSVELESARNEIQFLRDQLEQSSSKEDSMLIYTKDDENLNNEDRKEYVKNLSLIRSELRLANALKEEIIRLQVDNERLRIEQDLGSPLGQELLAAKEEIRDLRVRLRESLAQKEKEESSENNCILGLRKQVGDLEAQIFASGLSPLPKTKKKILKKQENTNDTIPRFTNINKVLASFVDSEKYRSVVLADSMGLLVAGNGDNDYLEELSALSGMAFSIARCSSDLLPLASIEQVYINDIRGMTVCCQLISDGKVPFSLTTLGRDLISQHHSEKFQSILTSLSLLIND
jgi:predicted regulator of Ras-like GTPase activity (Roadblock/LC7/MglB family)